MGWCIASAFAIITPRLGTANKSKGVIHGLHTSRFNIDESSLKVGMGLMAYLAIKN